MMKNYWVQKDEPCATWCAELGEVLESPEAVLTLAEEIREAGRMNEVVLPLPGARSSDGRWDDRGARSRWQRDHVLEVFWGKTAWGRSSYNSAARMAWADRNGRTIEGETTDLGALLRQLAPVPEAIPDSFMELGEPPVGVGGFRIVYEGTPPTPTRKPPISSISIVLHSDIWCPFVIGSANPWADHVRWFDNRALAARHTPRLNRFLAETKAAVIAAGGSWQRVDSETSRWCAPWVGPHGIMLDGPVPEVMPDGAGDVEWPID